MTRARRVVLDSEERSIHDQLLRMGELAGRSLLEALDALERRDLIKADGVIQGDRRLNDCLRAIERDCLVTLASQQPVAGDLRRILAGLHIAQELERIADHGANIAQIALAIAERPPAEETGPIRSMGMVCAQMLQQALESYRDADPEGARTVARRDAEIDALERSLVETLMDRMRAAPATIGRCTRLQRAAHELERTGDRITNIAERVVFMATGETPELN
jgi:phosphate transport system protein